MATTTNYGWTTPDDTALVKDGAAAIRTLGSSVDTTTKALNPETTLGDISYRSSSANVKTRLGIGSTGNVLTVAGGVPTWAAPASGSAFVGVAVTNSGHTNIPSATTTTITFNSEFYDTDAFHSTSTNTDRLTVPSGKAGKYLVVFNTQWQANDSGASVYKYVYIQKNGDLVGRTQSQGTSASGIQQVYQTSAIVDLAVGDYINCTVYTSSSNDSTLYFATTTPYYSYLSMAYLGA
jgi:hypothetical protein